MSGAQASDQAPASGSNSGLNQVQPLDGAPKPIPGSTSTRLLKKETCLQRWCNLGDMSNLATAFILVIGIILEVAVFDSTTRHLNYALAFGLYGFAGGVTNWMAIKMLFDKIPGVHGSGVIPERFVEIRNALKGAIMDAFFEEQFLNGYLANRMPDLIGRLDVKSMITQYLNRPGFDQQFGAKLEAVAATPSGAMLNMVKPMIGGSLANLVPMLKPMMTSVAGEVGTRALKSVDCAKLIEVNKVKREVDELMEDKLKLLTPEIIKELMDGVIRQHLGWLIVWGNLFGGLIGIACQVIKSATGTR